MRRSRFQITVIVYVTIISLVTLPAMAQQNAREVFERARMLDESNQNLSEAIKLYGEVVNHASGERVLAARAQFRIGILYERLGRKAEALRAFQVVANQYSDQSDLAQRARAKLPASAAKTNLNAKKKLATSEGTALTVRQVWAGPSVDFLGAPSAVCQITGDLGALSRLIWTPDGQKILFTVHRQDPAKPVNSDQTFELWQVSAAGGQPQKVGLAMERLRDLSLHPDGKRLAFAAGQSKPEVWVMENFLPANKLHATSVSRR